jgi:hypothetical protein
MTNRAGFEQKVRKNKKNKKRKRVQQIKINRRPLIAMRLLKNHHRNHTPESKELNISNRGIPGS